MNQVASRFLAWAVFLGMIVGSASADEPVPTEQKVALEQIQVSEDKTHFVGAETGKKFVVWGVNYDHDDAGRLLEDYWETEWDTVVADFREIKQLGANTVRIHLQVGKFIQSAEQPNQANLDRLKKLLRVAEETGLYLDITGLGCYHKQDIPAWYDELPEAERWEVQARFWRAVAGVCKDSPAVFCYDLMNEPVVSGGPGEHKWLVGEPLGGKYFVQRLTLDPAGRTQQEVAKQWVAKLTAAIREVDEQHMITVGSIPWAHVFKGAKPLFESPEVGGPLDFYSLHFYPKSGEVDKALEALKVYEVGKPLVVEEFFPLSCSLEEAGEFIEKSKSHVDGYISFYWGATIEESEKKNTIGAAITAQWLKYFRDHAPNDQ